MNRIDASDPDASTLFWQTIRSGGLVAYPTDTLYGLGADAENSTAAERLTKLKGRAGPFSVMVGHPGQLVEYGLVSPDNAVKFAAMLPGPYTVLLQPQQPERLAPQVIGPGGMVGFRVPAHQFVQEAFIATMGLVVTTSVNYTGQPPLQDPGVIQDQFGEQLDLLVDGGVLPPSRGSTVYDTTTTPWQVIRRGDGELI